MKNKKVQKNKIYSRKNKYNDGFWIFLICIVSLFLMALGYTNLLSGLNFNVGHNNNYSYKTGDVVYFNPVEGVKCSSGTEWTLTNPDSFCYKWNVIKENSDNVEVLLDHNIIDYSTWSNYTTENGPVDLIKTLNEYVSSWKNVMEYTSRDNVTYKAYLDNCTTSSYTVDYSGMKARLISFEEVKSIVGDNSLKAESGRDIKISSRNFLFSNFPSNLEGYSSYGYWTDQATNFNYCGNSNTDTNMRAYAVGYTEDGGYRLSALEFNGDYLAGIRPVIRINKKILID